MRLKRDWIELHIPHKGQMCLLDEVTEWDAVRVRCATASHRSPDNPLRVQGRLGAACGIEYATQAMAVHAALLTQGSETPGSIGFLGSLRAVTFHIARLDQIEDDLIATAELLSADPGGALYEFAVYGGDRMLLNGRATVVLQRPSP